MAKEYKSESRDGNIYIYRTNAYSLEIARKT